MIYTTLRMILINRNKGDSKVLLKSFFFLAYLPVGEGHLKSAQIRPQDTKEAEPWKSSSETVRPSFQSGFFEHNFVCTFTEQFIGKCVSLGIHTRIRY